MCTADDICLPPAATSPPHAQAQASPGWEHLALALVGIGAFSARTTPTKDPPHPTERSGPAAARPSKPRLLFVFSFVGHPAILPAKEKTWPIIPTISSDSCQAHNHTTTDDPASQPPVDDDSFFGLLWRTFTKSGGTSADYYYIDSMYKWPIDSMCIHVDLAPKVIGICCRNVHKLRLIASVRVELPHTEHQRCKGRSPAVVFLSIWSDRNLFLY